MSAGKLNATKRFAVRMSLVTGSTLATIIGAQSLALFDAQAFSTQLTPDAANVASQTVNNTVDAAPAIAPTLFITTHPTTTTDNPLPAAPNITILRHSGQTTPITAPTTASAQIAPPAPVQIAPPAPVVVQAPAPQMAQQAAPAPAPITRPITRTSRR